MNAPRIAVVVVLALGLAVSGAAAQTADPFTPARLTSGEAPGPPQQVVGGGEVLLEVTVDAAGAVTDMAVLRTTTPFGSMLSDSVRRWIFEPAGVPDPEAEHPAAAPRLPVASQVLVAAVYRPPAMLGPTLGETPRDLASPSTGVAVPTAMPAPSMPPGAWMAGAALVEIAVDDDGRVEEVVARVSAPGYDDAALGAARAWRFRPARVNGRAVPSRVYVVFGFPLPVVPGGVRPPGF